MKKLAVVFIFLCCFLSVYPQGLQFHGNEKTIAERSSLAIPAEENQAERVSVYELSFSIRNHNINSPGNIFCLHNTLNGNSFALTFNYNQHNRLGTFTFARSGERNLFSTEFPGDSLPEKTMPVWLRIDRNAGKIDIAIGPRKATVAVPELKETDFAPQLHFSMSHHMIESASFSIRDLRITADGEMTEIPLSESAGTTVHDSEGNAAGEGSNPRWLINKSYYWQPVWKFCSSTPTGFVFDPARQLCYSYNADSLRVLSVRTGVSETPPCGETPSPPAWG